MLHISHETPEETERRLLKVLAHTTIDLQEGAYAFVETPLDGPAPRLDRRTVALVRDDEVWSRLVRVSDGDGRNGFGLLRFRFPEEKDNSGFVGWLASHLKRKLGTGIFVICGQNTARGGIFDYSGFPFDLRDAVVTEIAALRARGAALRGLDRNDAEKD